MTLSWRWGTRLLNIIKAESAIQGLWRTRGAFQAVSVHVDAERLWETINWHVRGARWGLGGVENHPTQPVGAVVIIHLSYKMMKKRPVNANDRGSILSKGVVGVCGAGDRQPVRGAASSHLDTSWRCEHLFSRPPILSKWDSFLICDHKCLFTWLPVLLLPDTEKDCGLGLIVSSQAVYSIPQKLRSIRTHLEDKKRKTIVLSRKTYML